MGEVVKIFEGEEVGFVADAACGAVARDDDFVVEGFLGGGAIGAGEVFVDVVEGGFELGEEVALVGSGEAEDDFSIAVFFNDFGAGVLVD